MQTNDYTLDEQAILILDSLIGFEYKYKKALLDKFSAKELFSFGENVYNFAKSILKGTQANTVRCAFTPDYYHTVFQNLEKSKVNAITYKSEKYPQKLKEITAYPLVLYYRGNIDLINTTMFSIVGSRKTLPYAVNLTKDIAKQLSSSGLTIVTGSAVGGDRAAILGAIDSGKIISVIAHGHNRNLETNRELLEKVEQKGLVISEYVPDAETRTWMYPVRNRIIASLAEGCLIVSGDKKSGARYTADYSLEFNKDVYAIPYSLGITSGELCIELIKNGAYLCDGADCILQNFKIENKIKEQKISLFGNELLVYNAIKQGADNVAKIMQETGLKVFEIAPILSSLELNGAIVKLLGNKYKAVK